MSPVNPAASFSRRSSDTSHTSKDDEPQDIKPYALSRVSSYSLRQTRTNHSELSRILTGILDDHQLDIQEQQQYSERRDAEFILANQLDLVSQHASRAHSIIDIESTGEKEDRKTSRLNLESTRSAEEEIDQGPPKDKGFAWVMALCGLLAIFATWGANASYGVFLSFYLSTNTFPEATQYDFALIGGMVVFLANFLSPFGALLHKMIGFRRVLFVGLIIQTAGYILASYATKIWHLYVTQGFLVGVSFVLIFIPVTLVLPTWFDKKKATSMGIAVSGAGLGGLIFSLSINRVIEQTGDQRWALRMVGLVTLAATLITLIVMKPRVPNQVPLKQGLSLQFIKENTKVIFDATVFKSFGICALSCWFAIALTGYTLMLFSLSSYATLVGLTQQQGSILTSVLNAAQVVGRPCMGVTADRIGRANFTTGLSLMISILLYAFWINASTYGSLIAFSCLIGLIIGVGSSMAQPLLADVLEDNLEKLPAGWSGINMFVSPFCLVCQVIALSLVDSSSRPYLHTQIFAGTCFLACFLFMLLLRGFLVRQLLRRRRACAQKQLDKLQGVTRNGYLKSRDEVAEEMDQEEILLERIDRYDRYLRPTPMAYLVRIVYPVRV